MFLLTRKEVSMAQPTKNGFDSDQTRIFKMPASEPTSPNLMEGQRQSHPTLAIVKGPQTGVVFELSESEITLGRDPGNTVFLNDMTVSRHHAKMDLSNVSAGEATIEDLGSLNGTWVDGAIVNKAALKDGSTIQIGTFRMVFHTNRV
jgi:pSer/pThr/pTyr-binding forkhead associated (FHA) protein